MDFSASPPSNSLHTFSTTDILRDLFQKSFTKRQLPAMAINDGLIALEKKIDLVVDSIDALIQNSPQRQIEAVKTILANTKDSQTRKEIVQRVAELEPHLSSHHLQAEKMGQLSRELINHFWDLVIKSSLLGNDVKNEALNEMHSGLEYISTTLLSSFQEEDKKFHEKAMIISKQTEALTGTHPTPGKPDQELTIATEPPQNT